MITTPALSAGPARGRRAGDPRFCPFVSPRVRPAVVGVDFRGVWKKCPIR
jgi:hypothetical protein